MTGSLQQKNGKYYAVINLHINGKRKQKWIDSKLPIKGNKTRAERFLREQIAYYEKQSGAVVSDTPFADYIRHWLEYHKNAVDVVTYNGYVSLCNSQILPYFDDLGVKLFEVNYKIFQRYFDDKSKNGRLDGKGGLSANTLKHHKNILRQAVDLAIKEGYLMSNPVTLCELPKAQKYEPTFYTKLQAQTLLSAFKGEEILPMILITLVHGLRRSELCGLKWDCIDFENMQFEIKHTVVSYGGRIEKDKTKNQSSRRIYPLSDDVASILLDIKEAQKQNSKLFGKGYFESDYVFTWADGRPIPPDHVSHKFNKLLKKHNLPHIRFHDLRHTCASLLLSNDSTLKDVQAWLGHSSITMTADVYGHLDPQRKKYIGNKMQYMLEAKEC